MYIPTHFLPIKTNKPKPTKRSEVQFDKAESNPDTSKQMLQAGVPMYDNRQGEDRRKRSVKPLLDTRSGRDRRYDQDNPPIDIKA
ncbi:hypothetical protein ACOI22_11205 [Glaciecola sp. 2405UD65-10]|jgi:hypothetical protein|uniref:hypothetical protein n=1 Tax=Glaciecola sp. 2405UD65-10 TaxID=3397244 RepID=UPI003B5ABBB1